MSNSRIFLRRILSITIIWSLIAVYGFVPITNAASLLAASTTLSDSDLGVSATTTTAFTTQIALGVTEYIEVVYPADFGEVLNGNITCPADTAATQPNTETIRCTATAPVGAGAKSIVLINTANPGTAGSYTIIIRTRTAGNADIETANVMVAIIDDVVVTATVSSTLTFEIRPLGISTDVNGATTTAASATTTLAFGTLAVASSSILGQELRVTTNADNGYTVTVQQNQNLTSNAGSDIDAFDDGVPGAPAAWNAPAGTLDAELTYGHMGFTSEDANLSGGDTFGSNLWRGFSSTDTYEVMYHTGPADGTTADRGLTQVAYRIEISALQEAGDYTNTLTYVATPVY